MLAVVAVLMVTGLLKFHALLTDPFVDLKVGYSRFWLWSAVFAEWGVATFVLWSRWTTFHKRTDTSMATNARETRDRQDGPLKKKTLPGGTVGDNVVNDATETAPSSARWPAEWLALTVLFSVLFVVATGNVWSGRQDCGCAGSLPIPPVVFWVFDGAVLLGLIGTRPSLGSLRAGRFIELPPNVWGMLLGAGVVILVFLSFQGDSRPFPVDLWQGKRPISDVRVDLGRRMVTDSLTTQVTLHNPTDDAIPLVGALQSCTCVVLDKSRLPTIPARGQAEIGFELHPRQAGPFHQRAVFYLNSPQQFSVAVDFVGFFQENEK